MSKFTTELRYICETNAHVISKYPNVYVNKPVIVKDGDQKFMINRIECLCYTPELVKINGFRYEQIRFENDPTEYTITGNSYVIDNVFTIDVVPMIRNNIDEMDTVVFVGKENEQHSVNDIIASSAQFIFDFDYPIFDENYRRPLETKILKHYYTREICEETVALWKLRLDDRLNMIMPYYNKLYESELIKFNPLYDVDLTRSRSGSKNDSEHTEHNIGEISTDIATKETESTGSTSTETNSSEAENSVNNNVGQSNYLTTDKTDGEKWDLYSDTPQGGINGITGETGNTVNNNYFLTNARKNTDDITVSEENSSASNVTDTEEKSRTALGTGTTESSVNNSENVTKESSKNNSAEGTKDITSLEEYIETVQGKQGTMSYSKMLIDFRNTFLNIDKMIIDELKDLFFGLWA